MKGNDFFVNPKEKKFLSFFKNLKDKKKICGNNIPFYVNKVLINLKIIFF